MSVFFGYDLRPTTEDDLALAQSDFWLPGSKGETFLVSRDGEPLAFVKTEHYSKENVRIHMQATNAAPKKILRGITFLVPLIEKGLALRGVRAIFFTSHSAQMARFMEKHLGYARRPDIDGGVDGMVMAKGLN
jgi:hypothetical protein